MLKEKRRLFKIFAAVLVLLTVFAAALPALASENEYDLSNRDADGTEVFSAAELIEEHLGAALSDAERAFLESYSTLTLKYNSVINANNITLAAADGTLTVTAREYVYEAEGEKTLTWVPVSAGAGGVEIPLTDSGSGYVGVLESDTVMDVSVLYHAQTAIASEDFNSILNLYYNTAKYAYDVADYERKCTLYNEYLYAKRIYDDKKAAYEAYLDAYEEYEEQLYVYDNFEKLTEQYGKDLAEYNAYLAKLETLSQDIEKYEAYEAKLARIEKQLSAFELVYIRMKNDRDIYGAVMGGAVDQVLGSVGEIIAELGGKYSTLVKTAEAATKSFRGLMTEYKKCKTVEEKYGFYVSSYDDMCKTVLDLTWALDLLYYAPGVKPMMKAFEKHESYVILVAQLALTANALIDGEVSAGEGDNAVTYDLNWRLDGRDYNTILNNVVYFTDDDTSAPLEGGYPAKVEKPDIKEVARPEFPQRPATRPVAPESVADPGLAPAEVQNPAYPSAADSSALVAYSSLDAAARASLALGISGGGIVARDTVNSAKVLDLESIVYKKCSSQPIIITFDVSLGGTGVTSFAHQIVTDSESAVLYDGPIPENYSNVSGSYKFAGWRVEGTSEKADLTQGFPTSTVLVPYYVREPMYYSVTWRVGNEEIVEMHPAGSIPQPSFTPTRADEGDYCYEFSGWEREDTKTSPDRLYGDVVYVAKFKSRYLLSGGVGGAAVTRSEENVICDVSAFTNPIFDLSVILPKIAGSQSLTIVSRGGSVLPSFELKFSFTDVVRMSEANVVSAIFTGGVEAGGNIELSLYDKNNAKVTDTDVRPEVNIDHSLESVSGFVLMANGEYVNCKLDFGALSFKLKPSVKYTLKREYYVTVINNDLCTVSVDKSVAGAGDTVTVSAVPGVGVSLISIDAQDADGNPVDVGLDGKIRITDSDVVISVRAKYILYNVEFVSSGAVISRQELIYGAIPVLPPNPSMASDGSFNYTFVGWSPEVSAVTADVAYEAIFDKTPVSAQDGVSPDNPMANIMKYVRIALIVLCVILAGVTALVVLLIVRRVKRKKKARSEAAGTDGGDCSQQNENPKKAKKTKKSKGKKLFEKVKDSRKNGE